VRFDNLREGARAGVVDSKSAKPDLAASDKPTAVR
jgi:hypothetical protein